VAYCGEHTAVKGNVDFAVAVTLKCKSWTCPDCTDQRKAQLIAQGIGGTPNKFLTLTTRRVEGMTPEQAAKRLSYAWRLCRLRLMRHYKMKSLPFIAIMERHVSGWPHLHLLLRAKWLDQKLLSNWMKELADGPNVWIEHLDKSHKAVVYCAKYCGKCAQKIGTSKRYWQSRDYDQREKPEPKIKFAPGEGWEMWPYDLYRMSQNWQQMGYSVEWLSNGKITRSWAKPGCKAGSP
jgi:hypothetical protein